MSDERRAGIALIEQGSLVTFDVVETSVDDAVGGEERLVRIELALGEVEDEADEDDPQRTEDHEWGALGFMFCLAVLSFADARPRGASDRDFVNGDELGVADFLEHLRYERGQLAFRADSPTRRSWRSHARPAIAFPSLGRTAGAFPPRGRSTRHAERSR